MNYFIDIDEVCLKWTDGFKVYMDAMCHPEVRGQSRFWDLTKTYPHLSREELLTCIREFSRTEFYGQLAEVPGALSGVRALKARSSRNRLLAVTACGVHPQTRAARLKQLEPFPFDEIFMVDLNASKRNIYEVFTPGVVIDDHIQNINDAIECDHRALMFDQPYNQTGLVRGTYTRVFTWSDILEAV
jgi:hypothetical protein